ncbi:MAG TPA: glycosyltransferase family 4 protein [Pedococcus sp.]|nr:glycosyltransferase family 4 protein [Pedococcus sp.]
MKVLAVSTWYPSPAAPTAGVFVRKDCLALALDHEVTVVHLAPRAAYASAPAHETDGSLRVLRLPLDWRRPVQVLRAVRTLAAMSAEVDLVHSMAFSSLIPLALRRPARPWVHTEHWSGISAPWSLPPGLRQVTPRLASLLALPDVVAPVCEFLATAIRPRRGRPTRVVPCIVDRPTPTPARRPVGEVVRLVSVGGLVPGKDPVTAVRTVAELRARGVSCQLTWVGGGPLASEVLEVAEAEGVANLVELVGAVSPQEVARYLAEADVFLLPTRHENFCVSAAEALASGRPVVIGSCGGQAEYVDQRVGELVHEQTPGAYAEAVQNVLLRLAEVPAEEFSNRVEERFSVDTVRRGYHEVYALAQAERDRRVAG